MLFVSGLMLMLSSCSTTSIDDYASNQPVLVPQVFFNGPLSAHGVLKDRNGKVTRYFNASINAYWKDGVGTLEEKFIFDDGEIQFRNWTLTPSADGYAATAGDVISTGKAQVKGNAMSFGFGRFLPMALALEGAAQAKDTRRIEFILKNLKSKNRSSKILVRASMIP